MTRATARQSPMAAIYRSISEKAWQAQVQEIAALFGWHLYHTHDSRRSQAGFPDLCMVRDGRLVFAELKTEAGRVTAEQQQWLDDLAQVPGVEAYLWRPSDADEVERTLRR